MIIKIKEGRCRQAARRFLEWIWSIVVFVVSSAHFGVKDNSARILNRSTNLAQHIPITFSIPKRFAKFLLSSRREKIENCFINASSTKISPIQVTSSSSTHICSGGEPAPVARDLWEVFLHTPSQINEKKAESNSKKEEKGGDRKWWSVGLWRSRCLRFLN